MYIRIVTGLLVSALIVVGCKKDQTPSRITIKGLVLNKEGNAPMADAKVVAYFNYFSGIPVFGAVADSTQTDSQGQYQLSFPYHKNMHQYSVWAEKDGWVQASYNQGHIARGIDTVLLEKPGYLHITVKITQPVDSVILQVIHQNPNWFIQQFSSIDTIPYFKEKGTYTLVSGAFSGSLYKEAQLSLLRPTSPAGYIYDLLARKTITPVPEDTTHVEIEF